MRTIRPSYRRDLHSILYPYLVKSDRQRFINVQFLTMASLVFVVIPVFLFNWFYSGVTSANAATALRVAKQTETSQLSTMVASMLTSAYTPLPPTLTPVPVTPSPVPSPTVTSTPDQGPRLTFALSFYDPHIGAVMPEIKYVNCLEWDDQKNDCISKVNHGRDDYFLWYRRGAACGEPLHIGQTFRVVFPDALREINPGVWTCVDRGGAITPGFLDFMLRYPDDIWTGPNLNNFPWAMSSGGVVVELLP